MRLLPACLALLLLSSLIVAQDAPEPESGEAPEQDLAALYKVEGRAWVHRVTHWKRGGAQRVETWTYDVERVDEGSANVKWTSQSRNSSGRGTTAHVFETESKNNAHYAKESLPKVSLDMGFASFECRKHVVDMEGIRTTTWVSTEYHPLIVKQVKLGADSCEIRKLTAFDSGDIDPWGLMKVTGRSMKFKVTHEGGEGYIVTRVVAFDASGADWEFSRMDADGNLKGEPEQKRHEFDLRLQLMVPRGVEKCEIGGEAEIQVPAGTFDCHLVKSGLPGATQYYSKQWPELPIKIEDAKGSVELVEFDLGHDQQRLYRTKGNYSVTRMATQVAGMQMETDMRVEIKSVEEGKVTYVMTTSNEMGTSNSREQTMQIAAADAPLMPFDGQFEESVTVPAGTFRCIRTESKEQGTVTWTHHGVTVKMTMENNNMTMTQELVELKME